jgi:hypothetical protein
LRCSTSLRRFSCREHEVYSPSTGVGFGIDPDRPAASVLAASA